MPEFLSTHPSHRRRIENLNALVPRVDPLYQIAKAGKSTENIPTFLGASAKDSIPERERYAAKAAAEPDTMTFVSEPFEKFKRGEATFDCGFACAFSFNYHRGDWKTMHAKQAWRDLAVSVLKAGYLSDLSYFLLAEAAVGLNLRDAARSYYARAVEAEKAGHGCAGNFLDSCEGFEVKRLAAAALVKK